MFDKDDGFEELWKSTRGIGRPDITEGVDDAEREDRHDSAPSMDDDHADREIPDPPDEVADNSTDDPLDMTKEFIGQSEDTYYYLITTDEDGGGEDLVIVDQDGVKFMSARDEDMEVTTEAIPDFLVKAFQEGQILQIETSVFSKYILPMLLEDDAEELEEPESELEDGAEEDDAKPEDSDEEKPFESVLPAKAKAMTLTEDYQEHAGYTNRATHEMAAMLMNTEEAYKASMGHPDDFDSVSAAEFSYRHFPEGISPNLSMEEIDWAEIADYLNMSRGEHHAGEMVERTSAQDYRMVAGILRSTDDKGVMVDKFVEVFSADNPRFDAARFRAAVMSESVEETVVETEDESEAVSEMKIMNRAGEEVNVELVDTGTLNTVITINGREFSFEPSFMEWRIEGDQITEEEIKQLAIDAMAGLDSEEYHALLAGTPSTTGPDREHDKPVVDPAPEPAPEEEFEPARESEDLLADENLSPLNEADELDFHKRIMLMRTNSDDAARDLGLDAIIYFMFDAQEEDNAFGGDNLYRMHHANTRDEAEELYMYASQLLLDHEYDLPKMSDEELMDEILKPISDKVEVLGTNDYDMEDSVVDEKKKMPMCSKCNKAHWPFNKCDASDKSEDDETSKDDKPDEEEKKDDDMDESVGCLTERKSMDRLNMLLDE